MNREDTLKKNIEDLVRLLNAATKEYDLGHPMMSDREWDLYYEQLEHLEKETNYILPDSPTQKVIFEVKSELNKVTHGHLMLSLDKTKDIQTINKFVRGKSCVVMSKLDGLTLSLTYKNGRLLLAETRGNGVIGEDITHNAKVIKSIPKTISYTGELVIDGELICKYDDFEDFKEMYRNPRNFAAGSIRLLDSQECAKRKLTFVAWDCISPMAKTLNDKLDLIEKYGFTVVPHLIVSDAEKDIKRIQGISKRENYPIDGVVFKYNDCSFYNSLGSTEHHFKGGLAYKFYDETSETNLISIEWTMGRSGVLTPVAVFDPVEIDGTVVERASLHNISILKETLHGTGFLGQTVAVYKANQIIPQISEAEPMREEGAFSIPTECPLCKHPLDKVVSDTGVENLMCVNEECGGKLLNSIEHFCGKSGVDMKGISTSTLSFLIDEGWVKEFADLYTLAFTVDKEEWINSAGWGESSVDAVLEAIDKSRYCTFAQFLSAIGIPQIGSALAKTIAKQTGDYDTFRKMVEDKNSNLSSIDGIAVNKESSIREFDYSKADAVYAYLKDTMKKSENIKENLLTKTLEGINIVITGSVNLFKNREEFIEAVEKAGGKVQSSVSGKTNILVNNDINSTTGKNKKAKELGILIMTEEEFVEHYLK